jgi:hypothetical protein
MNKKALLAVLAIVAMAAFTGSAMAGTIPIGNYNMEANASGYGAGGAYPAAGWQTVENAHGDIGNTVETYAPTAADFPSGIPYPGGGTKAIFNYSTADNDCAVLTRTNSSVNTTAFLTSGLWYTYTLAVGQGNQLPSGGYGGFNLLIADPEAGTDAFAQEFHGTTQDIPAAGTFQNYGIIFSANDVIDNDTYNSGDHLRVGGVIGVGTYFDNAQLSSWTSLAAAQAAANAANPSGTGIYVNEHTSQLEYHTSYIAPPPATPEPSTFVLLVSGLMGLLAYAWRKRK